MRDSPLPEPLFTFHAVVLAHAIAGVRSGLARLPGEALLQSSLRPPLPLKPESAQHDSFSPRRPYIHKSHLPPTLGLTDCKAPFFAGAKLPSRKRCPCPEHPQNAFQTSPVRGPRATAIVLSPFRFRQQRFD